MKYMQEALLILRMTADSAHVGQFCAKCCTHRIAEFWHPYSYYYYYNLACSRMTL